MGRKRKTENYDAILRACYRIFLKKGYDNTTAQDIEKESNVHTGNLYRYVKSKDEALGAVIESIEKQMLEYLHPVLTNDPFLTFTLFTIMKYEYAINNPDYFRMRASLIARPHTFIKNFMTLFELSYPQQPDWKSDEHTMFQGLFVLGGMLMVQYGFVNNISGNILSEESADFMTNYNCNVLSEDTTSSFRRFMDYALRSDLHILGLADGDVDVLVAEAYSKLDEVDIRGFRSYYEEKLGFN